MRQESDGSGALDELYWRSEILQVMYWMQGEGLATDVTPANLAGFLVADPDIVRYHMRLLAAAGLLDMIDSQYMTNGTDAPPHYRLSEKGRAEGGRSFADDFAELTRQAHGECAPGCWCQDPSRAGEPCPSHPHHY